MKFTIAAAAIAATSSFVFVGVHASNSKSGKGPCSSSPKLDKFCNEEPANFEGTYKACYNTVIRNSANGRSNGAIRFCADQQGVFSDVFTPLDDYGAYDLAVVARIKPDNPIFPVPVAVQWETSFQGVAIGNTLKMTSYGGGVVNGDGEIILPNYTPDTQECTLYDDDIMQCTTIFTEYCGPDSANSTVFPSVCEVGDWVNTYTIQKVAVLEGSACPEPPEGFCDQTGFGPSRKLQDDEDEEEEEASHPCPLLNGSMN